MPVPSAIRADDLPRVMAAVGRETGMREPETLTDAELCLYLAPGIGPRTLRKLRAHFPADVVIVEASEQALTEVPGVGRKTANLVTTVAFNKYGICVDVHVHRICNRLGLIKTKTPLETEMKLREILPKRYWKTWNSQLVSYGQTTCLPRNPLCPDCQISQYCDSARI